MKKKIGVITAGADCAGINSTVRWLVSSAMDKDLAPERGVLFNIIGIIDGWDGMIKLKVDKKESLAKWTIPLSVQQTRTWDRYGGTRLGTSRINPFDSKNDQSQKIIDSYNQLKLDALIVIGGIDSLGAAYRFHQAGLKIIGIPKTIDRDLSETEYTLGFDSALNGITADIDRLRTTAGSHSRIFVVECMGRKAGWLALEGGEASGASIILIPEHDFAVDRVVDLLKIRKKAGQRYSIVLVSEGAQTQGNAGNQGKKRQRRFRPILSGGRRRICCRGDSEEDDR